MKKSATFLVIAATGASLLASPGKSACGYRNPIIYADVPDMSVCYADSNYYMVSTTMHLMPGAPVMKSRDMRRWETVSYVFDSITDAPRYSLVDSTAYGQGQWASSLRFHDGRFYCWFTANGSPGRGFVYVADNPSGPWKLLARPPHFHDGSLLFDDDGRVYMFHGTGHLTEFAPDLSGPLAGGLDRQLFERDSDEQGLLEGSSVVKKDGRYYLLMISMDWGIPGRVRREVCYRADSLTGNWEKRVILEAPFDNHGGVGQGCIVEGPAGQWNALIFQDRGGVGRTPCLMPVRWVDGWPMLGDENGRIPDDPSVGYSDMSGILGSDSFNDSVLNLYWQWNHNPDNEAWSLTRRPGWLRLATSRIVDNLFLAPNTLTQRMKGPRCQATVKMDVSKMKDGDHAGMAAFNGDSGVLTVVREGGEYRLTASEQKSVFAEPAHAIDRVEEIVLASVKFPRKTIYLRIKGDFDRDEATFQYSTDGKIWNEIGRPVKMTFDHSRMFMGSKFALFNYATKCPGGYVDIDYFDYE